MDLFFANLPGNYYPLSKYLLQTQPSPDQTCRADKKTLFIVYANGRSEPEAPLSAGKRVGGLFSRRFNCSLFM